MLFILSIFVSHYLDSLQDEVAFRLYWRLFRSILPKKKKKERNILRFVGVSKILICDVLNHVLFFLPQSEVLSSSRQRAAIGRECSRFRGLRSLILAGCLQIL